MAITAGLRSETEQWITLERAALQDTEISTPDTALAMKGRRVGWVEARRCHGYDVQTPICSSPGGEELPKPSAQFGPGWSTNTKIK
jgi:hypothetical protein